MSMESQLSAFHLGSNVIKTEESRHRIKFQMRDDTGEGTMMLYDVFPGIMLMFNDFRMDSCISEFRTDIPVIGIDYCREGRIEWEMPGGSFLYLQAGDLQIDPRRGLTKDFGFPLNHYNGITVAVNVVDACSSGLLSEFGIDATLLYELFCTDTKVYIKREDEIISHIFSQLYTVGEVQRISCFRVMVLELLLYLYRLDPTEREIRTYFPKQQVDVVKEIARFLVTHLDKRYSVEYLSKRFHIPATTLKLCFKGVFGLPIGQYMREYRMNEAARLLKTDVESVSVIAGRMGYDNQSKFAAAFKTVKGKSPREYSKVYTQMD